MRTAKFKVGDVLKPVLDDTGLTKLHVIEVLSQECPSLIKQFYYRCRVHTQGNKSSAMAFTSSLFELNEIEVELYKEQTE